MSVLLKMLSFQNFAAVESEIRLSDDTRSNSSVQRNGSSRWMVIAVFAVSMLVTVVFWKVLPNDYRVNEQSDYFASYEPTARSLIAGRGFTRDGENLATEYPPGHPLILAGVFAASHALHIPEETGLSALAMVGMGLSAVLVFFLARLIWGTRAALVSATLWMTYPFALWLTKQPNSEIPFIVVLYAGLLLFWFGLIRRPRARAIYFVCGLLCGSAMLIRPIAIGIGVVLAGIIWIVRREDASVRLLPIGLLLLGNLVAVLPWEAYVYSKTGRVLALSTNDVRSLRDGLTFAINPKGYRGESSVSPDVAEVMGNILAEANQILTVGQLGSVVAREFRSHPAAVTKISLLKIARSWYGTDSGRQEWLVLLIQIAYLGLILWSIRWAWIRGGIDRGFAISALLITIYFWGMTILGLSILRYMVPAIGLLFVLVGGACASRWSLNRRLFPKTQIN